MDILGEMLGDTEKSCCNITAQMPLRGYSVLAEDCDNVAELA